MRATVTMDRRMSEMDDRFGQMEWDRRKWSSKGGMRANGKLPKLSSEVASDKMNTRGGSVCSSL